MVRICYVSLTPLDLTAPLCFVVCIRLVLVHAEKVPRPAHEVLGETTRIAHHHLEEQALRHDLHRHTNDVQTIVHLSDDLFVFN
jgi:hypothetical protein